MVQSAGSPDVPQSGAPVAAPGRAGARQRTAWRKLAVAGLALSAAALCAFLWAHDPQKQTIFVCVFRLATGLYCPGCGSTRAMHLLLHLHPYAALRMNPGLVLLLPILAYCMLDEMIPWALGRRIVPHWEMPAKFAWTLAILVIAYAVLRNVPVAPFTWLVPTAVSFPQ